MSQNADYTDYDRITDSLLYLSDSVSLKFVVVLSKKAPGGERRFFHSETMYQSRYIGTDIARSIVRNMTYYFVLAVKNDFTTSFVIRPQDAEMLKKVIQERILPWYFGNKRIYKKMEDKLSIVEKFNPVIYAQSEYQVLRFEPIVVEYDDGYYKEGIRLTISNVEIVEMDIDKFFGFINILNTDMYCAACSLVNFAKIQPYGVNTFSNTSVGLGSSPRPMNDWNELNEVYTAEPKENNISNKSNSFLDNVKVKKQKNAKEK